MNSIFYRSANLLLSALMLAGVSPVLSQMRNGVPEVLSPPAIEQAPDPAPVFHRFRAANSKRGRPRMLIFWNRALSDEVAARYQSSLVLDANGQSSASGWSNSSWSDGGSASEYQRQASASARVEFSERNSRIDEWARLQLEELTDWEIQGSFASTMISGGARLIDRNLIIRTTGKDAESNEEVNTYALETEAMMGKADLLMEILLAVSQGSPTGVAFQISVKDINSGELIATLSTPAEPPATQRTTYAATSTGFVRQEHTEGDSLADVGRTLALETMTALSMAWEE